METDGDQTDQERMVAENTVAGMPIGSVVTATDPNGDDTLTYALGGTDMASFSIVRDFRSAADEGSHWTRRRRTPTW